MQADMIVDLMQAPTKQHKTKSKGVLVVLSSLKGPILFREMFLCL